MIDYKAMGKRIRLCRLSLGLTQEALAEEIEVSTSFIGHLERGEKQPSLETVARLCAFLGMTMDYLALGQNKSCEAKPCDLRLELQRLLDEYRTK